MHSSLLTIQETAIYLHLHPNTVYKLSKDRRIPATKVGGQWRYHPALLEAWIAERMQPSKKKEQRPQ